MYTYVLTYPSGRCQYFLIHSAAQIFQRIHGGKIEKIVR